MSAATLLEGFNIANVERVVITTHDDVPKTYSYQTMSSFDATPKISEGEEKTQRIKNQIMGRIKPDDILEGYDLECEDERLILEVLALVDGGTLDGTGKKYSAPKLGEKLTRTMFDMVLYTSNRDADGSALNYLKWNFPNCKGTPVTIGGKDNDFTKQKYKISSRANIGESPFTVDVVETLPDVSAQTA